MQLEGEMLVVTKNSMRAATVYINLGVRGFFDNFYKRAEGFEPILREVWRGFQESEGTIFSNC